MTSEQRPQQQQRPILPARSAALPTSPDAQGASRPDTLAALAAAEGVHPLDTEMARKNIPGFVTKLYRMVADGDGSMIRWNAEGTTFLVAQHDEFSRHMLPRYFKHNNFSSFVRQLNMYGFHKVPQIPAEQHQQQPNHTTHWEFSHPSFRRGRYDLLLLVRRKMAREDTFGVGAGAGDARHGALPGLGAALPPGTYDALAGELQQLRTQQDAVRSDIGSMQRENQMLWNEVLSARERHLHQQQVIEKILRFLASIFSSENGLNPGATASQLSQAKRQLLLEDVAPAPSSPASNLFVPSSKRGHLDSVLRNNSSNSSSLWGAPADYHAEQQQRIFNFVDTTNEMDHDIDELQRRLNLGSLQTYLSPLGSALVPSPKKRRASSPMDDADDPETGDGDFDISAFLVDDSVE